MKKPFLLTIFLGLILVLAACGGDDNTSAEADQSEDTEATETVEDSGSEEESEESEASEEAAPNNDVTIVGYNFGFDQEEYVVQSGEEVTLTYVNDEGHHGIGIDELDVDIQGEGEVTFIPEEPGRYEIYCNIFCGEGHDEMIATLVVL